MAEGITAYPLCWPTGYGRRPEGERKYGHFGHRQQDPGRSYTTKKDVTIAGARKRLQEELDRLGAREVVLSSNVELRLDGQPRSDRRAPEDPAVALYFRLHGKPVAMPCDTYTDVAQNIAALAAHIEATRQIARHGVASIEAMFTGFMAIRGPGPKPWREVLGFPTGATPDAAAIKAKRTALARQHHPDAGGSAEMMAEINAAADRALEEIENG